MLDPRLKELAQYAARIAKLLEGVQTNPNHLLVAVLDDLLGAIYSLVSAVEKGFKGKTGSSEFDPILTRAKQLANGQVRRDGNWMAGFHFNSGMFRISAVFARLPEALSGSHERAKNAYLTKTGKPWENTDAHAIREEVNALKHDEQGVYARRLADLPTALLAVGQLLELAETLL